MFYVLFSPLDVYHYTFITAYATYMSALPDRLRCAPLRLISHLRRLRRATHTLIVTTYAELPPLSLPTTIARLPLFCFATATEYAADAFFVRYAMPRAVAAMVAYATLRFLRHCRLRLRYA